MIIAGTGHRPPKLGLGYTPEDGERLRAFAREALLQEEGVTEVVAGMAQGWDQALAEAALDLGIPLYAAVPFLGMQAKWPPDGRARYEAILRRAARVEVVSAGGYAGWKFAARDRHMVDRCDVLLALYDEAGGRSGTGITVAYAREVGRPVRNVWEEWLAWPRAAAPSPR